MHDYRLSLRAEVLRFELQSVSITNRFTSPSASLLLYDSSWKISSNSRFSATRPGAEFGRNGTIFRGPRFLNNVFLGKNFYFQVQHFWRPFLVIDQVFRIFPFFLRFYVSCTMLNVVYDPFLTRTTTISENNSFMTPFFTLFVLSRASDNNTSQNTTLYFSKYWGTDARATPPHILGGPSPSSP